MAHLLQTLTDHGKVCVGAGRMIYVLDEYTFRVGGETYGDDEVRGGACWTTIEATRQAVMHWLGY